MWCFVYMGSLMLVYECMLCISLNIWWGLILGKCPLRPLQFSGLGALLTLGWDPKDRAILWAESDSWPVRSSEPCRCTRQGRTTDSITMNAQSGSEHSTLFHTVILYTNTQGGWCTHTSNQKHTHTRGMDWTDLFWTTEWLSMRLCGKGHQH